MITCTRTHNISCGHRIPQHEGKCKNLHGHNYRIHLTFAAAPDKNGFVVDFGVVKKVVCERIDDLWDHKTLIWREDPFAVPLSEFIGVRLVDFCPSAENMAHYLLHFPWALPQEVELVKVRIEETAKCSAEASSMAGM